MPPEKSAFTRWLDHLLLPVEELSKEAIWDCRMCGQCILHSTGLTCPMRCPKNLRNGPCGGVRPNGNCEVYPDKPCVWVEAVNGSKMLPLWRDHIHHIMPPVDWQLEGTSSWTNLLTGRDKVTPEAWLDAESDSRVVR
jgi:Methylene-tetrahydrofolate reductase C terminal